MSEIGSFSNMLLAATPTMSDPNFYHTVIYICEHQPEGAVGLIINRPMEFPISMIFEQLQIQSTGDQLSSRPLLFGGPIST